MYPLLQPNDAVIDAEADKPASGSCWVNMVGANGAFAASLCRSEIPQSPMVEIGTPRFRMSRLS